MQKCKTKASSSSLLGPLFSYYTHPGETPGWLVPRPQFCTPGLMQHWLCPSWITAIPTPDPLPTFITAVSPPSFCLAPNSTGIVLRGGCHYPCISSSMQSHSPGQEAAQDVDTGTLAAEVRAGAALVHVWGRRVRAGSLHL